jgi:hypothetical protein
MANATWDIAQHERHLPDGDTCPDGEVYTAHWTASLEEHGESASAYGSIGLGDADPATLFPFDEMTKDQRLSVGCLMFLVMTKLFLSKKVCTITIQQKINPTSEAGVPW